jgi:hypothetical protein
MLCSFVETGHPVIPFGEIREILWGESGNSSRYDLMSNW